MDGGEEADAEADEVDTVDTEDGVDLDQISSVASDDIPSNLYAPLPRPPGVSSMNLLSQYASAPFREDAGVSVAAETSFGYLQRLVRCGGGGVLWSALCVCDDIILIPSSLFLSSRRRIALGPVSGTRWRLRRRSIDC